MFKYWFSNENVVFDFCVRNYLSPSPNSELRSWLAKKSNQPQMHTTRSTEHTLPKAELYNSLHILALHKYPRNNPSKQLRNQCYLVLLACM